MNATREEWRPIPGHPEYEVSNQGRVKSWRKYNGGPAPRIRKPVASGRMGHLYVQLATAPCESVRRPVHQLVLEAFVGPRPDGMVTRHLDGNPTNNHLDNLAYGTPRENTADMFRHGTYVNGMSRRTHCPQGHAYDDENTWVDKTGRRHCRTCRKADWDRRNAEAKAARAARGPVPRKKRPELTHCKHGHEFTPENTYFNPKGFRNCRICRAARRADERARRAAKSQES